MRKILISLSILIIFYGCAKTVEIDRDADFYKSEGDALAAQGKYKKAAEWYEQALMRAESPSYAADIQLSLADSHFLAGKYKDAIPVYEVYLDVYRDLSGAKLATVRLGLAYFNIVKLASRDQHNTEMSLKYFLEVKARYPELVEEYQVDERIALLRERLAKKEIIIAKYYARILKPEPEMFRYRYIISNYSDTVYYGEAMDKLIRLLLKRDEYYEAKNYYDVFELTYPDDAKLPSAKKRILQYEENMKKTEEKKHGDKNAANIK